GREFDIHGGGLDLRFPHHENELAQSRAAGHRFARHWMHNAWVTAAGEKMSKSLGNGALVSEVTRRFPPRAVRFYLVAPHYRSAIEFSDTSLSEATAALERIDHFVHRAETVVGADEPTRPVPDDFAAAMNDDLSTPGAMAVLYNAVREGNQALTANDAPVVAERLAEVRAMLGVLGLDPAAPEWSDTAGTGDDLTAVVDALVGAMLEQRQAARQRKDYATSDRIRDQLAELGVQVTDTPNGPEWELRR
ncbi:MAG: class I tRNA ligase family protein, partial [Propionibacterium sp.]|nr:class I tRNA ligase family protein [Propionibacterium sp.]